MASLYNTGARLTVNNAGFIAGFAAAERAVNSFMRTMTAANASMGRAQGAMVATAGAAQRSGGRMSTAMNGMAASTALMTTNLRDNARNMQATEGHARALSGATERLNSNTGGLARAMGTSAASTAIFTSDLHRNAQSLTSTSNAAKVAQAAAVGAGTAASTSGRNFGVFGKATEWAERDLDRFNRTARGFSMTAMGLGAISLGTVIASFREFASYESAFADFEKVTEATKEEFRDFDLVFREMGRNLPATYEEISQTAAAASQLGIEKDAVETFTETMIRMGTATNLSSEDAAFALSRLMNIMGTSQSDVDRLGSTIVELGNNYAATEEEISRMSLRIAGMGSTLGMSEADVLALAASMTSLGIRAEMGGSAISTIMSKTASEIERGTDIGQAWADVMGMSIEEVATLMQEDAYGALIKMVEGLESVDESGGNLDQTLRDLGISEMRQLDVMKRLTGSSEELSRAQNMANGEWEKNTALIEESAQRYETFESQMRIMKNSLDNIFSNMGNAFVQSSEGIIGKIAEVIENVDRMTDSFFDAEGGITETGETFVQTASRVTELLVALGLIGGAFMLFGPGGGAVATAIAGVSLLQLEFNRLKDAIGDGSPLDNALFNLGRKMSEPAQGAADEYLTMKDDVLRHFADLTTGAAGELDVTKEEVLGKIKSLNAEIKQLMDADFQEMDAMLVSLAENASDGSVKMVENARDQLASAYRAQLEQVDNSLGQMNRITENAFKDNRTITANELQQIASEFTDLDAVVGSSISKNIDDMAAWSNEMQDFNENTTFDAVQQNVTEYARSGADAISELDEALDYHTGMLEASNLPAETKSQIQSELNRQYQEGKLDIMKAVRAYEIEAQQLHDNIDATAGLSQEQKLAMGVTEGMFGAMSQYDGIAKILNHTLDDSMDLTSDYSDALSTQGEMTRKAIEDNEALAAAYEGLDGELREIPKAFEAIQNDTDGMGLEIGEAFVNEMADGIDMVDLGPGAEVKVDEFVAGIQSGEYKVEDVALAQVNKMRNSIGAESLDREGAQKMFEFASGFQDESHQVTDLMDMLGLDIRQSADSIDLGASGVTNIAEFVEGLASGKYGVTEIMTFYQNQLQEMSSMDLRNVGEDNIRTLNDGVSNGFITTEQLVGHFTDGLPSDLAVNLEGTGIDSVKTLADGYRSGEIDIHQFFEGLNQATTELARFDFETSANESMQSMIAGLESGTLGVEHVMFALGEILEEAAVNDLESPGIESMQTYLDGLDGTEDAVAVIEGLKSLVEQEIELDLTPKGAEASQGWAQGIIQSKLDAHNAANEVKTVAENEFNTVDTTTAGIQAGTLFGSALDTQTPIIRSKARSAKVATEDELGSTTDGGGGNKAGNTFFDHLNQWLFPIAGAAEMTSAEVESKLGSTTDGQGGATAGALFSTGLASQRASASASASGIKFATESALGSTTDSNGGNSAGSMFASGLAGQIGNATSNANSAKNNVQSALGSTTDGRGGNSAGSMFASGIAGQIGNATSQANANKSNVESALGSTTDNDGGRKALMMYVSAILSFTGRARNVATQNSNAVSNALGATTDGGGGLSAGRMFVSGVSSQSGAAGGAGRSVSSSARSGLSSNSNTYGLGQNFGSGFVRGIRSYVGAAVNAAANLARSALNAVKRAQRSSSPSKETMNLGGDFGDGFALAIVDKTKEAMKAARGMASSAINAAGDESARAAFNFGDFDMPKGQSISHRLSAEMGTFADVELSGRQPAYINVNVGGQEFETFSDNIYSNNVKQLNFRDSYDV